MVTIIVIVSNMEETYNDICPEVSLLIDSLEWQCALKVCQCAQRISIYYPGVCCCYNVTEGRAITTVF